MHREKKEVFDLFFLCAKKCIVKAGGFLTWQERGALLQYPWLHWAWHYFFTPAYRAVQKQKRWTREKQLP